MNHAEIYFGMMAVVRLLCVDAKVAMGEIHFARAKKRLTGRGNADKALMLEAAVAAYPDVKSHDQADAYAVGLVMLDDIRLP